MGKVISIALQKGGTGKSTTALCLASILGSMNKKVLLIDLDDQCNSSFVSHVEAPAHTITDVLGNEVTAADAITSCKYYDLIPGDSFLANIERSENVKPSLLKEQLKPIIGSYDEIVIDTPPALGNLSFNAIVASDYVIIPTEARPFSINSLTTFNKTLQAAKKSLNPTLSVLGILLVKYNTRTVLNRDLKDLISDCAKQMDTTLFETHIRESVAVPESQAMCESLIDYAPKNNSTQDYIAFTHEVLKRIGA